MRLATYGWFLRIFSMIFIVLNVSSGIVMGNPESGFEKLRPGFGCPGGLFDCGPERPACSGELVFTNSKNQEKW